MRKHGCMPAVRGRPVGVLLMLAALVAAGPGARGLRAQGSGACTYDACGLRLELGALLRGIEGTRVGGATALGGDVDVLLEGPDSAVAYADGFLAHQRRAGIHGLVSSVVVLGLMLADLDGNGVVADGYAWAVTVAVPVAFFNLSRGARHERAATRSLGRSVWWYNRQFTDAGAPRGVMEPVQLDGKGWDWLPVVLGGIGAGIGYAHAQDPTEALIGSTLGAVAGGMVTLMARRF